MLLTQALKGLLVSLVWLIITSSSPTNNLLADSLIFKFFEL